METIFARVRGDAFPPVGAGDAEYMAGLGAAVAAAVEYVVEGIERGADGVGPIPAAVCEQARRAARVGVSLDTVLRRYVAGHAVLEEVIMEAPARGEDDLVSPTQREALRAALRAQASVLDRLLVAITSEYGDELERGGRSPEQRRAERVRRLLDGELLDRSGLGYELDGWHLGMIAVGDGAGRVVRGLAAAVDRPCLSVAQGPESVWAWFGGRERLTVGEIERAFAAVDEVGLHLPAGAMVGAGAAGDVGGVAAEAGVALALGEPGKGMEGWRLTHRQAQAALLVALRRPEPRVPVWYADVALLALAVSDEMLAGTLRAAYLAPLAAQRDGGVLSRQALRAYFATGRSVSSAAAALGVSRNTIESRLRGAERSLERSLPGCLTELEVALRLEELDGLTDR